MPFAWILAVCAASHDIVCISKISADACISYPVWDDRSLRHRYLSQTG
jgi:hypothetical protein